MTLIPALVFLWQSKLPQVAATIVSVPRVSSNHLLSLQEGLQDQPVGLTQPPPKLSHLPSVLECVRLLCESFTSGVSISYPPLILLKSKTHWPSKPNAQAVHLSSAGLARWGT